MSIRCFMSEQIRVTTEQRRTTKDFKSVPSKQTDLFIHTVIFSCMTALQKAVDCVLFHLDFVRQQSAENVGWLLRKENLLILNTIYPAEKLDLHHFYIQSGSPLTVGHLNVCKFLRVTVAVPVFGSLSSWQATSGPTSLFSSLSLCLLMK